MFVDWTKAGRSALDAAISRAPAHLSYAFQAVRDQGCAFVFVAQGRARFWVPPDRPVIVLLGDDMACSLGPAGFHDRAVRQYLASCGAGAVIASEPVVEVYREAVAWAVAKRENVVIVETRPSHEAAWLGLIREAAAPDIALALATTKEAAGHA